MFFINLFATRARPPATVRSQAEVVRVKQPAFMRTKLQRNIFACFHNVEVFVFVLSESLPRANDFNVDATSFVEKICGIATTVKNNLAWMMIPFIVLKKSRGKMSFAFVFDSGDFGANYFWHRSLRKFQVKEHASEFRFLVHRLWQRQQ